MGNNLAMKKIFMTESSAAIFVIRVVLGVVFFAHGMQKVFGWFGGHGYSAAMGGFEKMGIPVFFAFMAILAESLGSIGLILGFLTRIAAFGIAVNMAVAIGMIHHKFGFFMNWSGNQKGEGFEYHLLVLAICIALMIKGGGSLSVDRAVSRQIR